MAVAGTSGGLFARVRTIVASRAHAALDRIEDVPATLDYSYVRLHDLHRKAQSSLVDVATARKGLEQQLDAVMSKRATLHAQAALALRLGRDELAHAALTRRAELAEHAAPIVTQHAEIAAQEARLTGRVMAMRTELAAFRTRKETLKATYSAAQAQVRAGEALAGISGEGAEAAGIIDRAQAKTALLQARAGALGELHDVGTLPDALGGPDAFTRELQQLTTTASVESELASLRAAIVAQAGSVSGSSALPPGSTSTGVLTGATA